MEHMVLLMKPWSSLSIARALHHLEDQTSFEGGAGHEGDGRGDVASVHTDHVGELK